MSRVATLERALLGSPPAIAMSLEAIGIARGETAAPGEGIGALLAGGGGSALPWWSPIAVCLLLFTVAFLYRLRDRSRSSGGGSPEAPGDVPPAAQVSEPPNRPEGEPESGSPGPGGTLHSRPVTLFPATVDGRPLSV